MKVVVIGGTGHVGTYLVPRLVELGHEVVNVSRGTSQPYQNNPAWAHVEQVTLDREAEDADGTFGQKIAALEADAVIDMVCFTLDSARQLVEALRGNVQHFLHCGSIWIHGYLTEKPVTEEAQRAPFGEYGIQKSAIERYLMQEARLNGFPATAIHPGHIMGPGWELLTPLGNRNMSVFSKIAKGEEIVLPNLGLETVHHVHADDVAQGFVRAMMQWNASVGESFHIVSPAAVTLRGYAETVYRWFGRPPRLSFMPWEEWRTMVSEADAAGTWDHIAHSPNASIEKARRLIAYQPRYTSFQALREALDWYIERGEIETA